MGWKARRARKALCPPENRNLKQKQVASAPGLTSHDLGIEAQNSTYVSGSLGVEAQTYVQASPHRHNLFNRVRSRTAPTVKALAPVTSRKKCSQSDPCIRNEGRGSRQLPESFSEPGVLITVLGLAS